MKIPSILLALAGAALAGMHGYNACYVATGPGWENLNVSSSGFHIDSARNVAKDSIINRNTFTGGYVSYSDRSGGMALDRRGDSLIFRGSPVGTPYGFLVRDDLKIGKFGSGMQSRVEFYADSIVDRDTMGVANPEISWTLDRFTADSLYSSYWTPKETGWVDNIRCRATLDTCSCSNGGLWVYGPGAITESYQGVPNTIHYTSVGPALGVTRRKASSTLPSKGPFRIDGSLRAPTRDWMPAYGR